MLKVKDIYDVQCLKLWYEFVNNELSHSFTSMFIYNHKLCETVIHSQGVIHLYLTRIAGASNVVRHRIPDLLLEFPTCLTGKMRTHNIGNFVAHFKSYIISLYSYQCTQMNYYICQRNS